MDKIKLTGDDGEAIELYVMETTRLNGTDYYLVTEDVYGDEDEDGVAYLIKEVAAGEDGNAVYECVEDDDEMEAVAKVLEELMDDTELM